MQAIKSENIEIEWLIIESFKTIRKVSIAFSQTPPEIFRSEKMRTLNFSDYSLSRFISLYTSFPGFYSRKKKRVQSTKKQNFFITVHSRAVIRNFFSSEKKVFESVATFDVSLLCPSKLSLLHNLQDKQEKGNLDAHRWSIESEVRFFFCMHL